jgi:uncharacterized RDD family membrane protein YckC
MAESTFAATGAIAQDIAQESKLLPHLLLRWAGAWIDLIALALFLVIPDFLLGNEVYRATMAIWIGVAILYFPIAEGFWGRTAGKLVTGLIVVDRAGNPPGLLKAVVRTVLRLVEVNPLLLGGIPAAIAVVASKRRQRLGDMLARTYVVRFEALRPAISDPMPVERKAPDGRSVLVFTIGPVSLLPAPRMQIQPRQLGACGAGRGKGPIAEFTADPADRSALGLCNLSDRTYRVTLPGGTCMDLGTGQTVRLLPGTVIDFGGIGGTVHCG